MFNYTTYTENGMVAYNSTDSALLDLFFEIGNITQVDSHILDLCARAFDVNPQHLMSIILWARDCRQGAGRRNAPRVIMKKWFETGELSKRAAILIMMRFVEVGRWDDVWHIALDTPYEKCMIELVREALENKDGLCAKWLPRKGPMAAKIRKLLELSPKQYRKTIVSLTDVVETKICEGKFHQIDYNHVPAKAMSRYAKLFSEKDAWRFEEWKDSLKEGTAKPKVKVLYPYEILKTLKDDEQLAEAQWKEKAKEVQAANTSFLPIIDTSGSMCNPSGAGVPCLFIAVSIGLLLSECANNAFRNRFLTFSEKPTFVNLENCKTLKEKVHKTQKARWDFNTNLEAAMFLLLRAAKMFSLPQEQLPKYLLIVSDMQFDQATECDWNSTALNMMESHFLAAGYTMPKVVFWNVAKGYGNVPAVKSENNVIMISGFNTNLFDAIIKSPENITPMMFLQDILDNPRYHIDGM